MAHSGQTLPGIHYRWDNCQLLLEHGADPGYRTPAGEDLKTGMDQLEQSYADMRKTPADYAVFKKRLRAKSGKKP
ncbi:hypothetical protein GCM10028803_60680 [Larkinella knui]|uniref:Ankyrin repeat domain-containing protein n=1 Tax=Larkinella knui TaxID=2025310 RepID=A0A3P1CBG4_9BACT|nr:hypothetical protein [Larkinella knui]RRB10406.1 hypothetical protein EHT87_29730 [Larkinella knui]